MVARYVLAPAVGVARLGNSPDTFYLEPETTGGRPIACDDQGNAEQGTEGPSFVEHFKDSNGRVKR